MTPQQRQHHQLLILADDLSGAADCAGACLASGLHAVVALDEAAADCPADVLSLDCDTRHLAPAEAANRVARYMAAYKPATSHYLLVKKIDSCLRGNIAAELAAVLAEQRSLAGQGERVVAVMAPAFPSAGRTTLNGCQLLDSKPLHETEMWAREGISGTAHIPALLSEAGLVPATVDLSRVRSGPDALRSAMLESSRAADVVVCDAETDADLNVIASASLALGRKTVWAGSAGLMRHLPLAAGLTPKVPLPRTPNLRGGPTLFVVGSMSAVSHRQASQLAQHSAVDTVHVSPRSLLHESNAPDLSPISAEIAISLEHGRDTLMMVDGDECLNANERRLLTDGLGQLVRPHRDAIGALVVTGGETARAVLAAWRITALQLLGELEPGLPYSIADLGERALPVLTKAGSFGNPETLLNCREFLDTLKRSAGDPRRTGERL